MKVYYNTGNPSGNPSIHVPARASVSLLLLPRSCMCSAPVIFIDKQFDQGVIKDQHPLKSVLNSNLQSYWNALRNVVPQELGSLIYH